MTNNLCLAVLVLIVLSVNQTLHANVKDSLLTYEVPSKLLYSQHNDDFTVKVRKPGHEWQDLYEYKVEVDMDTKSSASMVYFDFTGTVEIMIRKNNGMIHQVAIRPRAQDIIHQLKNNMIYFSLNKPTKLSIEIDGDKLHNLHLFANAIESDPIDPDDPNVIYFGPGYHEPKDPTQKFYNIPSNKTVYIHGSAVVNGKLLCKNVRNVKICGRGILFQPERGVEVTNSENIIIDGITVINPKHYTVFGGATKGLTINNLNSFSSQGWSDGVDLMSCSDVSIDGVFMRNSDDCIAIYAHRWDFYGNAHHIQIKNSTLWSDIAHATNIGLHGYVKEGHPGDTIEQVSFTNIDILEHDEDDRNYQGCMSINASDNNYIRDVTYENVRVDDFQEGQLFNIRIVYNEKYSKAPGRSIENIVFKNISYNGMEANPSIIKGYSADRKIGNITFQNLKINGKKVSEASEIPLIIGPFVENVSFP